MTDFLKLEAHPIKHNKYNVAGCMLSTYLFTPKE